MLGDDYEDLGQFVSSCKRQREALDARCVLGKVYNVDELRKLAETIRCNVASASGRGRAMRYSVAQIISEEVSQDDVGNNLSWLDHSLSFPVVTYYRPPNNNNDYLSYENFVVALISKDIDIESGFYQKFNGFTEPPPHNCLLESVKLFEEQKIVSMLFSCTRALVCPDEMMTDNSNLFLARIPVLIKIHFSKRVIEFSMPIFSEPIAEEFGYVQQSPIRYQQAFHSAYVEFLRLIPHSFMSIRFNDLPLWLESNYDAKDMGWKIAPQVEADFDLTQNLIPLKDILDNFVSTLNKECENRGATHQLQDINLYHVFRSLKDESYTYSMVQKVPFGKRGGGLILSILYGRQDARHYPIILLANASEIAVENLRDAVSKLFRARINNPYSIDSLFVE